LATFLAAAIGWKFAFAEPTEVPPLASIERMTDTRDPRHISGSFWTQKLDCTYKNPPHEWIVWSAPTGCDRAEHNLQVLKTKRDFFIPRSTANDDPPFCLMHGPASRNIVTGAEHDRHVYCRK
jgi:hypothetical protein